MEIINRTKHKSNCFGSLSSKCEKNINEEKLREYYYRQKKNHNIIKYHTLLYFKKTFILKKNYPLNFQNDALYI